MGTLNDLFSQMATKHPHNTIINSAQRTLTYQSVENSSNHLASALLRHGVQLGDPVLIHCSDHAQALVAQVAVLKLGGVCVPVPHHADTALLGQITELSGAMLVLCSNATREHWSLPAAVLDDERTWAKITPLRTDGSLPRSGAADVAYLLPEFSPDGSVTGHLIDHRAWLLATGARLRRAGRARHGISAGTQVGSARDLVAAWWAIAAGTSLQEPRPTGGTEFAKQLRSSGISSVHGPDEYAALLTDVPPASGTEDRPATVLITGGPLPAGTAERHAELLPYARLLAEFSPRDGAMPWTARDCGADSWNPEPPSLVGTSVPRVRVTIRNPDGEELPAGATGQIWAAGTALPFDRLCDGCHDTPVSHRGSFTHSGYLGRWTDNGSLQVLDRTHRKPADRLDTTTPPRPMQHILSCTSTPNPETTQICGVGR
ncbi:hypothetical protein GCM10010334_79380 [Streptomyces finlayi]|uniref:AMP-dependent synthetase/ligase domain-containing protein n=1 Tax=Streptomyces finlayi TaxID=67296 RepID=A0A918X7W3_9ACTN|nr:hypothetical protein GCM10010334_79380 [Streptomyces finlayi]